MKQVKNKMNSNFPSLVTTSYTTTINPTSSWTSFIITTSHQTIS